MKKLKSLLFVLLIVIVAAQLDACKKEKDDTPTKPSNGVYDPTPYVYNLPSHFPGFYEPDYNKATVEGVALGKRIYYDKMLSLGGALEGKACASCHNQATNFSNNDPGTSVMPHTNLVYASAFLWIGSKAGPLEKVMEFEISEFFQANISLFKADTTYQRMCFEAFGTKDIGLTEMSYALAQWLRTHISGEAKFDRFYNFEENLTPLELRGYQLFTTEAADCFHCHSTPITSDYMYHNIGLDSIFSGEALGRFNFTHDSSDIGKFKTPSLRNVAVTAPYMHDGRFATLEEVVEHYNSGVKRTNTLDPIMTKPGKEYGLLLSDYDKAALVAFLKTFTDDDYLTNPEFADPFE
jgi:cytochrome c peroxidase